MSTTKNIIRDYKSCLSKSGTTIIFTLYTHKGRSTLISTGESILPEYWDYKNNKAKRSLKGYIKLNLYLQGFKEKIDNIVRDARIQNIEPVTSYIINKVNEEKLGRNLQSKLTFFEYLDQYMENGKVTLSPATIAGFKTLKKHLKNYESRRKIKLNWESFTLSWYDDYKLYFMGEDELGNGTNAFGGQIKRIKILLNSAAERGYNKHTEFKKKQFKILSRTADTVFLNEHELKKIYELDLSEDTRLERIRDLFIVGAYTGLRFCDFSQIKPENISANYITILTQKTNQKVVLPFHPFVKQILQKYRNNLPKVSNQWFNYYIKDIARIAGIKENVIVTSDRGGNRKDEVIPKYKLISAHTARRSFATNLYMQGLPSVFLMKLTGHKTDQEFMKYIKVDEISSAKKLREFWGKQFGITQVMAS